MQHWSEIAPLTCLMSVDATPLVLPRRRGVLPLLNLVEVGKRLHIYSVSCLRRCVLQSKTLNDCIAISQLHRNFAIFQKLQRNFRILHVKLHFFVSPFVPSPFGPPKDLPTSNGSILPLSEPELQELAEHVHSGHVKKSNLCKGCLEAEGPRRIHRTIRDINKATHTLRIDIAGPLATSDDDFTYFLVGALRLPGFPLLIDVRLLTTRTSTEVCDELEKMVAFFAALQSEGFPIGETCRVKRVHSDRAGEFTAPYFARFIANHRTIHHSFTSGYDPQANGTAERAVGLIKSLAARCLANFSLDGSYWSFAVRYAAQSLLCRALQLRQKSLPFGTTVVAQVLGHRDIKFLSRNH